MNVRDKIDLLSLDDKIAFAVFCVKKVSHLHPGVSTIMATAATAYLYPTDANRENAYAAAISCIDDSETGNAAMCAARALNSAVNIRSDGNGHDIRVAAYWTAKALNNEVTEESLFSEWLDGHLLT
jgi:hypothetical protein